MHPRSNAEDPTKEAKVTYRSKNNHISADLGPPVEDLRLKQNGNFKCEWKNTLERNIFVDTASQRGEEGGGHSQTLIHI